MCSHMCICIHIHTYIHTHTNTWSYMHISTYTDIYIRSCLHVCASLHTGIHLERPFMSCVLHACLVCPLQLLWWLNLVNGNSTCISWVGLGLASISWSQSAFFWWRDTLQGCLIPVYCKWGVGEQAIETWIFIDALRSPMQYRVWGVVSGKFTPSVPVC